MCWIAFIIIIIIIIIMCAGITQSVQRLATGLTVGRSISLGAIFSSPVQIGPATHTFSSEVGTGVCFQGLNQLGRGVVHRPQIAHRLKKE